MSQAQLTPAEREAEGWPGCPCHVFRHVIPRNAEPPHVIFAEGILCISSPCLHVYLDVDIIIACAIQQATDYQHTTVAGLEFTPPNHLNMALIKSYSRQ
jgi:hypothetical protein